jgi:hypothetical protein
MIFKRLRKSTKEEERKFREDLAKENIGFKDTFAMLVSAFFVLVIPSILVLVGLLLLVLFMFGII